MYLQRTIPVNTVDITLTISIIYYSRQDTCHFYCCCKLSSKHGIGSMPERALIQYMQAGRVSLREYRVGCLLAMLFVWPLHNKGSGVDRTQCVSLCVCMCVLRYSNNRTLSYILPSSALANQTRWQSRAHNTTPGTYVNAANKRQTPLVIELEKSKTRRGTQ